MDSVLVCNVAVTCLIPATSTCVTFPGYEVIGWSRTRILFHGLENRKCEIIQVVAKLSVGVERVRGMREVSNWFNAAQPLGCLPN